MRLKMAGNKVKLLCLHGYTQVSRAAVSAREFGGEHIPPALHRGLPRCCTRPATCVQFIALLQNASTFYTRVGSLRKGLKSRCEFVFVDAPFEVRDTHTLTHTHTYTHTHTHAPLVV